MGTEAVTSSGENVSPILLELEQYFPDFKLLPVLPGNGLDPIYEARLLGFSEAWDAQQAKVERLNDEADRLWLRANNSPTQIKEIQQRQTEANYAAYERRFMAGEAA